MINIFYHATDLDGQCSGALARYYYEEICHKKTKLFPMNYGDPFPYNIRGKKVVILDFSFPIAETIKIMKKYDTIFIDHHKTFYDDIKRYSFNGIVDIRKAACELAWEYFFKTKYPKWVSLLGQYDRFHNHGDERWYSEVLPFQYGMRVKNFDPKDGDYLFWKIKIHDENDNWTNKVIDQGRVILQYQASMNTKYMKSYSYESMFEHYNVLCMNSPEKNSQSFKSVFDPDKHDIMFNYVYNCKACCVSLYSTKVDVSEIARKYGGGGHPGASGFECKNITNVNGKLFIQQ